MPFGAVPSSPRRVHPLDWGWSPEEALRAWPREMPVVSLWSGEGARWTVLARSVGEVVIPATEQGAALERLGEVLDGRGERVGGTVGLAGETVPFVGGWIGYLSYGLGRRIEPAAAARREPADERGWPLAVWHRCPAAYVHDRTTGRWVAVGRAEDVERLPALDGAAARTGESFELGELVSATGRVGFERSVARVVESIRAGDVFQVNLAHRLSGRFSGSARGLFLDLARRAAPAFGAYIEGAGRGGGGRVLASISPELFIRVEPAARGGGAAGNDGGGNQGRISRVVTRPIKGTRRGDSDPAELEASQKDRAELNMIVDLMRNDLGRVCEYGSVRVDEARRIERAGGERSGVWHGVATVSGELRAGLGLADLLRAAFPPGSVTGAPKIKAMQMIEELEPVARGPYCGAIGYVSDCGRAEFSVAIRTAMITGRPVEGAAGEVRDGVMDYFVGAGIVADSDPASEWQETMDKAGAIRSLAGHRMNGRP